MTERVLTNEFICLPKIRIASSRLNQQTILIGFFYKAGVHFIGLSRTVADCSGSDFVWKIWKTSFVFFFRKFWRLMVRDKAQKTTAFNGGDKKRTHQSRIYIKVTNSKVGRDFFKSKNISRNRLIF